jgi:hypothetical protein
VGQWFQIALATLPHATRTLMPKAPNSTEIIEG